VPSYGRPPLQKTDSKSTLKASRRKTGLKKLERGENSQDPCKLGQKTTTTKKVNQAISPGFVYCHSCYSLLQENRMAIFFISDVELFHHLLFVQQLLILNALFLCLHPTDLDKQGL
jgi:hypothetical protein